VTFSLCEDLRAGVRAPASPRRSPHAILQTRQELPHERLGGVQSPYIPAQVRSSPRKFKSWSCHSPKVFPGSGF
jgi:hypothetical protein